MISPLKLSVVKCSSLLEEITADDDLGAEIVDDRREVARTSSVLMLDSAAWTIFSFCQALSKNQLRSLLRDQDRRPLPNQLASPQASSNF